MRKKNPLGLLNLDYALTLPRVREMTIPNLAKFLCSEIGWGAYLSIKGKTPREKAKYIRANKYKLS